MTCSLCHERGHNKRGCPKSDRLGASSSTAAAKPSVSGKGRSRPKKSSTNEDEPTVKRGRGRLRKTTNASAANAPDTALSASVGVEFPSTSSLGSWFTYSAPSSAPPDTVVNTSAAAGILSTAGGRGRGRGRGGRSTTHHSLESWFSYSAPIASDIVYAAPSSSTATRGRGRGIGSSTPYKRPRLMGMSVFQAKNGFTAINPGLPSSRIVSTRSSIKITRSAVVTGGIGFKPTSGLKWKGKQAITTKRLQEIRDKSRNAGSQPKEPWKL
ncbi:uncharacterized protein [Nicotiana tomentosiformis]|uniref:uncharacterized protein n=1 Tax=Nicotiana tomentosiformis TaxID=4098 RepID=UPI00051AB741|nr:uncharacterized protein LOC104088254 [Nicotiana tomentosiformis]